MNDTSHGSTPQSRGISATEIRNGLRRNHILACVAIVLACVAIVFSMFVFAWFQWIDTSDDSNSGSGVYYTEDGVAYTYHLTVFDRSAHYPDNVEVVTDFYDPSSYEFNIDGYIFNSHAATFSSYQSVSSYLRLTLKSDCYVYFYGFDIMKSDNFGVCFYDYLDDSYSLEDALYVYKSDTYYGYCGGFASAGTYYVTSASSNASSESYSYMIVVTLL